MAYAEAQIARGHKKHLRGDFAGALTHYRQAIRKSPSHAHAWYFFGLICQQLGRYDEAIRALQYVLKLAPKQSDAWYNLGRIYQATKRPQEALAHYIAALEHQPNHVESLINAGNIYREFGELKTAEVCYHHALAQDTTRPESKYTRAFLRLADGDYERGWKDHEWRWACAEYVSEHAREWMATTPKWNGEPMPGRTLLIHWEQGFGDTIQFSRYINGAAERSQANVIIEMQKPMVRLMARSFPFAHVCCVGDALPHFDAYIPIASLPSVVPGFGAPVPYLHAEKPEPHNGFRVGLCWGGNTQQLNDYNRSVEGFAMLYPILGVPGIQWLSLQVGKRASECPESMPRITPKDFADTADAIAGLDLVITVDTSIAHVAGAVGVPVWIMVAMSHDWRYPREGQTTPWYPSARLYRQTKRQQWADVIGQIAYELDLYVNGPIL